jgi:hypothetical protein|tara:strand:- start:4885 stop:5253 length:369 start_codon:yes stop_codon:yes gene_type:complete
MRRIVNWYFYIVILLLVSCIYYTYLVVQVGSMNPQIIQQEILNDTTSFGAWAFLLDILFLFLIGVYVKKRMARKKEKKWVSSFDGKSELIMDLEPLPEPPMPPPPPTPQQMELLGILKDENL